MFLYENKSNITNNDTLFTPSTLRKGKFGLTTKLGDSLLFVYLVRVAKNKVYMKRNLWKIHISS